MLVAEEMRRVLWYFWWKRTSWLQKAPQRNDVRDDIREGLAGYAAKQVAVLDGLATQFANEWYLVLAAHRLETDWPEKYLEKWRGIDVDMEMIGNQGGYSGGDDGDGDTDDDVDF
jgi:hypothetical protein